MIKGLFWLCSGVLLLGAVETKTQLHLQVEQGRLLSTKIIYDTLSSAGFKIETNRFSLSGSGNEIDLTLLGRKSYDSKWFGEALSEHHIALIKKEMKNKEWYLTLDASSVVWNVPPINEDESATLGRSINPYWFVVDQANMIRFEAPYGIKWYPDIAVLDENMQVLLSRKESRPHESLTLKLPPYSKYLKVSNANGMKILKEGLWVENTNEEQ